MLKNTCTAFGIWVLCTLVPYIASAQYYPPPAYPMPDLITNSITVQSLTGNTCTFRYVVKNIGTRPINLQPLQYSMSFSIAAINTSYVDAGTGLLSTDALSLAAGETYSGTATATGPAGINFDQYHYLTFYPKPRPGNGSQEMNVANNSLTVDISYASAAITISDFSIMNIQEDTITYWYTIKNTGSRPLYLDRFTMKTYVSKDSVQDMADLQTSTIVFTSYPTLAPGASFSSSARTASNVDFRVYKYLLANASLTPGQTHPYLSNTFALADVYLPASFPDAAISGVQVDSVIANQINYHAYLRNAGGSVIDWNKYYVQVYLSQDQTLQEATDLVINTNPLILSDQVVVGSFLAPVSLNDYPYLILQIHPKSTQTDPFNYDTNTANDWGAYFISNSFPNLTVSDVQITHTFTNGVSFTYTVEAPVGVVHLDDLEYATYFSTDDVYDESDVLAGTRAFVYSDQTIGGPFSLTDTGSVHANIDIADYSYLIFVAKSNAGPYYETDYTDNQFAAMIPLFIVRPGKLHPPVISYFKLAQDTDNVKVENTSEQQTSSSYVLHSLSGDKVSEGDFYGQQQINTSNLKNGLYILQLKDENNTESVKFIVQH